MSSPGALPRVRDDASSRAQQEAHNLHEQERRRRMGSGKPNWAMLSPLAFAALPVIAIAFRKQPALRNRLFAVGCAVGVIHGVYNLS